MLPLPSTRAGVPATAPERAARRSLLAPRRRLWATAAVSVVVIVLVATLAAGIVTSQQQSRSRILSTFALRGTSSATFVAAFLGQQAQREQNAAAQLLAGARVTPERFDTVVAAFGSGAAVLLDDRGRVLDVVPADASLTHAQIASRYAHLAAAERGAVAVSGVVPSAVRHEPVAAIAVPFATSSGRRVFSAAYGTSGSTLAAFVDHTVPYPEHGVYLVDAAGHLVAASPRTDAGRLSEVDPALARAVTRATHGTVAGARTPTTFTVTRVPGTSWRLVIAVPDSRLYASINGWTSIVPWLVFVVVTLLALMLTAVVARLMALSERMALSARTDALTGLLNRRALTEHLARVAAHARRAGEPMSVLMIDLDRFKQTNDLFGHRAGDRVLRDVADCMRSVLRGEDVYGRWGGDEFVVLLPGADEVAANAAAERLRAAAAAVDVSDVGLPEGVPLSVGVATSAHATPDEIIHAADVALYAAKRRTPDTAPMPA